ncbi:MAG: TonB family protein [Gemmatimonadota bacterium]
MFAQLTASAPSHDATARPTIISGLVHLVLIALAIQVTRGLTAAPSPRNAVASELYLAPRLPAAAALPASAGAPATAAVAAPNLLPTPAPLDIATSLPAVNLPAAPGRYGGSGSGERITLPTTGDGDAGAGGTPWRASEVDETVSDQRGPQPLYPAVLARSGISGEATLQYIVDSTGRVEPGSIIVIGASRPEFGAAATVAISAARFTPAKRRGVAVRQLVRQLIRFSLKSGG